ARKMMKLLKEKLSWDGFNVIQNNGELAGQSVFHFHMHLIPRYKGDGLNFLAAQPAGDMEEIGKIRDLLKAELQ
ncbi:MAG: HIT family protein, partial [Eubacterium sp.]|nr:HIT family protein [Eubacterium sp.]